MQRVGYGAMQLAGPGVWGPPEDPATARRVLRRAVELGVTFFDTANAYGPRTVNRLIGEALGPLPADVIVGNKVGAERGPDRSWIVDGRPETVRRQVHEALTDLGTETSELTYLRLVGDTPGAHRDVPLEESLGALVELREQGLIRRIGLSGASPEMLARARRMTPVAAVQNRFNLLDRSGVQVLADCEAQGILFVPYFPLAAGRLGGHPELAAPAERLGVTPAQIALAWLLRRSPAVVVIPGTRNPEHLRSNVEASAIAGQLTEEEVARLTGLVDESTARLDRPSPPAEASAYRPPRTE
ncbi:MULTISPECIES: aldo/keto reductase [Streptomyces]|uniref:Aldo/keto reductase n=2 Tax=Streptomyces griseoaurantiacus TaxID=68213 RepID=A0ABZ1VAV3_9ACTN|nr:MULTISPECIES: aldo/keto reductase [Streptomyces]MBA5224941.1 aldo/keto reductase [Streptomyces griseoaurantiacus]MDX3358525.1 aldo/keto reductase [Streptomyces sp. ME02-6978.2a]WTI24935.1 aldo/keto reductase [Streptomyces jietaisiensis]